MRIELSTTAKKILLWLAAGLLLSGILACSKPRLATLKPTGRCNYSKMLSRWTENEFIYDGFSLKFFVYATQKSPEFKACYCDEVAKRKGLSASEAEAMKALQLAEAAQYRDILVGLYTVDRKYNNLDEVSPTWNITAVDSLGNTVVPLFIKSISKGEVSELLYPYLERWYEPYLIRFPKTGEDRGFVLRFDSLLANAALTW